MRALSLLLLALTPALALAQSDSGSADDGGYVYYQTPEWVAAHGDSLVSNSSTPVIAQAAPAFSSRAASSARLSPASSSTKAIPQVAEASDAQAGGMSDTF